MAGSPLRSILRKLYRLQGYYPAGRMARTSSSGSSTMSLWTRLRRRFGRLSDATLYLISTSLLPASGIIITLTASPPSRFVAWSLLSLLLMMWTLSFFAGRFIGAKQRLESFRRWEERLPGLLESATRPYRSPPCRRAAGGSSSTKPSGRAGDEVFDICHLCRHPIYWGEEFSSNFKGLSEHRFCKVQSIGEDS